MDHDVQTAAAVFAIIFAFLTGLTGLGIVIKLVLFRSPRPNAVPPNVSDERFQRLERAVDAIAIEVERISESQRFTAKILAERGTSPALPDRANQSGRINTPH